MIQDYFKTLLNYDKITVHEAQLVSALPSVLEVPSSILSDSNICSDFSLICVAIALNTRKIEHWQREGVKGALSASIDNSSMNWRSYQR